MDREIANTEACGTSRCQRKKSRCCSRRAPQTHPKLNRLRLHGPNGARFWVALFDAGDGRLRAVIEGDWLGRLRTGAASGLATKYLAHRNASIFTIIGAGSQALTQVLGVAAVRPLREIRVFSRDAGHRAAFAEQLSGTLDLPVRAMASLRDAVDGAEILTTITPAAQPIFPGEWLQAGQHLNVCGSNYPDRREVDGRTIARADLLVADGPLFDKKTKVTETWVDGLHYELHMRELRIKEQDKRIAQLEQHVEELKEQALQSSAADQPPAPTIGRRV